MPLEESDTNPTVHLRYPRRTGSGNELCDDTRARPRCCVTQQDLAGDKDGMSTCEHGSSRSPEIVTIDGWGFQASPTA
ncbi:hypothetical protein TIFTF001_022115 [Ficus carica]|uniref:Uncharacterized protein n=1 Tax=Ficus carica TaxID=3494 RepID=A0AA88ALJ7_FICCA|nr:hypothetical protein TIFTF001_022115 [Ficus carica]